MTGPEHYREAERLVKGAKVIDGEGAEMTAVFTLALTHATLALAAATALVSGDNGSTPLTAYDEWSEVAGSPRKDGGEQP